MNGTLNSRRLLTLFALIASNLLSDSRVSSQSILLPQPSINLSTHTLYFIVPGASDVTNAIQFTPSLTTPTWTTMTNQTGGSLFTDNITDVSRFYRTATIDSSLPSNLVAANIIYTNGPNAGGPFDIPQNYGSSSVTFVWEQITNQNIVGYKLFYGPQSQVYTKAVIVGDVGQVTINGLNRGLTNYFVISALTSTDVSVYSPEVVAPAINNSPINMPSP